MRLSGLSLSLLGSTRLSASIARELRPRSMRQCARLTAIVTSTARAMPETAASIRCSTRPDGRAGGSTADDPRVQHRLYLRDSGGDPATVERTPLYDRTKRGHRPRNTPNAGNTLPPY